MQECKNVIFVVDRVDEYSVHYHCEKCGRERLNATCYIEIFIKHCCNSAF